MKKRNINKVIVLTLSLVIAFSTVAGAKTKVSTTNNIRTAEYCVDPYPKEGGVK